jgi:hypothetical protein
MVGFCDKVMMMKSQVFYHRDSINQRNNCLQLKNDLASHI